MTAIERIEQIIKVSSYKGIKIQKEGTESDGLISVGNVLGNGLPDLLREFINENYCVIFMSADFIQFYEFNPIGYEIYHDEEFAIL